MCFILDVTRFFTFDIFLRFKTMRLKKHFNDSLDSRYQKQTKSVHNFTKAVVNGVVSAG